MKPVSASYDDVYRLGRDGESYIITLDGVKLDKCFDFNEAEGTAEVWITNERGGVIAFEDGKPRSKTLHGDVRLVASSAVRAWFEEHFAI